MVMQMLLLILATFCAEKFEQAGKPPKKQRMMFLAIASEAESWRQRKASQEAQASYNEWLRLRRRQGDDEE